METSTRGQCPRWDAPPVPSHPTHFGHGAAHAVSPRSWGCPKHPQICAFWCSHGQVELLGGRAPPRWVQPCKSQPVVPRWLRTASRWHQAGHECPNVVGSESHAAEGTGGVYFGDEEVRGDLIVLYRYLEGHRSKVGISSSPSHRVITRGISLKLQQGRLRLVLGDTSLLEGLCGIGTGCPGQWWGHHPWGSPGAAYPQSPAAWRARRCWV